MWQNIEDKATVSAEIHRVLRPGGRRAMLEVIRLGSDELHYAVPWPDGPAENFVASAEEATATLGGARFETLRRLVGEDVQSAIAAAACDRLMATGVPGIRFELLMLDYEARMGGLARNVETGLIGLALALFQAR